MTPLDVLSELWVQGCEVVGTTHDLFVLPRRLVSPEQAEKITACKPDLIVLVQLFEDQEPATEENLHRRAAQLWQMEQEGATSGPLYAHRLCVFETKLRRYESGKRDY